MSTSKFREELERLINCQSMENGSDTPDFILAKFLCDSLVAFDKAVEARTRWHGPGQPEPCAAPLVGLGPCCNDPQWPSKHDQFCANYLKSLLYP